MNGVSVSVVLATFGEDPADHPFATDMVQEVMHDTPLVVPHGEPARLFVKLLAGMVAGQVIAEAVVEPDHGQLNLADDPVLVIAEVADQGDIAHPGQIIRRVRAGIHIGASDEFHALEGARCVVEIGLRLGAHPVDAIKVERRRAGVARLVGRIDRIEACGDIQRDVVIDELAEKHEPHRDGLRGHVRATGIHRAARPAEALQNPGVGEERRKLREHAPETVSVVVMMIAVAIGFEADEVTLAMRGGHKKFLSN